MLFTDSVQQSNLAHDFPFSEKDLLVSMCILIHSMFATQGY